MEISERFHYHQQILEKMVATHAKSVQESPRRAQPDSSAEMGSPLDTERDDASRDDLVDGELEEMLTSDGLAPELDNGVEEADGGGRSLRYYSIDHSVHVLPWVVQWQCVHHPRVVQYALPLIADHFNHTRLRPRKAYA